MGFETCDYVRFAICGVMLVALLLAMYFIGRMDISDLTTTWVPDVPETPWQNGPDVSDDDMIFRGENEPKTRDGIPKRKG